MELITSEGSEGISMQLPTVTDTDKLGWKLRPSEGDHKGRPVELCNSRPALTALDILGLDISAEDRLRAVLRRALIPDKELHELSCRFASRALRQVKKAGHKVDDRSWTAITVKRRWLREKATNSELRTAVAAAWGAAGPASCAAAWAASNASADTAAVAAALGAAGAVAWVAAEAAGDAAARSVTDDLARPAARFAARALARPAAKVAEAEWQVDCVSRYLRSKSRRNAS